MPFFVTVNIIVHFYVRVERKFENKFSSSERIGY